MDTSLRIPFTPEMARNSTVKGGGHFVTTMISAVAIIFVVTALAYIMNPHMFDGAFRKKKKRTSSSMLTDSEPEQFDTLGSARAVSPGGEILRDDPTQYLIDPRKQIGFPETKGGVLRNANQQIRAEPIVDKRDYTWMNSTIDNEEYGLAIAHA